MGKFSTLEVREFCRSIGNLSRSTAESCDGFDVEGGLVAIGIQPVQTAVEKWANCEADDDVIALYMYPLEHDGHIDYRFCEHIGDIEGQMHQSAENTSKRLYSEDIPVSSDLGVATCYNVYSNSDNKILLRVFVFVSGSEKEARECCYATRKFVKEWAISNGFWIPRIHYNPARLSAAG